MSSVVAVVSLFAFSIAIAPQARAATVQVEYHLSGGIMLRDVSQPVGSGVLVGSASGSVTLSFAAIPTGQVVHGMGKVKKSFQMKAPFQFPLRGDTVKGTAYFEVKKDSVFTLLSANQIKFDRKLTIFNKVHCTGMTCNQLTVATPFGVYTVPLAASVYKYPAVTKFSMTFYPQGGHPTLPGSFTLVGLSIFAIAGPASSSSLYVNITGAEISRTFVPEPSTLPFFAMGLLCVGLARLSLVSR